jgi:hypothetical protein
LKLGHGLKFLNEYKFGSFWKNMTFTMKDLRFSQWCLWKVISSGIQRREVRWKSIAFRRNM